MRVTCPSCGAAIPGVDIDLARGLAVCRPCGEVVPLPSPDAQPLAAIKAYKPAGLRFDERAEDGAYVAVLPPERLAAVPLLFFCLFWDGFMIVWYAIAISHGVALMALFGLGHLAAGIYVTHRALVTLLNVRTFRIGGGRVRFRSAPIPFAGNLDVALEDVDGFALRSRSDRGTSSVLVANLADGTQRKLGYAAGDAAKVGYVADSFNDALKRARAERLLVATPFRG